MLPLPDCIARLVLLPSSLLGPTLDIVGEGVARGESGAGIVPSGFEAGEEEARAGRVAVLGPVVVVRGWGSVGTPMRVRIYLRGKGSVVVVVSVSGNLGGSAIGERSARSRGRCEPRSWSAKKTSEAGCMTSRQMRYNWQGRTTRSTRKEKADRRGRRAQPGAKRHGHCGMSSSHRMSHSNRKGDGMEWKSNHRKTAHVHAQKHGNE